ncbi:unnamed protein product [Effrenium voratum]|uniref:Kringle domain-containing protein n=1 Tax=Effrenium voratum TaxID=2562239 RepID=A0AA36HRL1_9DINO|nr:unnamed protein product [Effrenium voratum]
MGAIFCCCCSSKEDDEKTEQKFAKGGDKDISGGPVKNRHCTDLLCLILFIVHWGAFCAVIFVGMQDGEPAKLYQPRDFKGDYCDLGSLVGATKLLRTLNVSATVDEVAKQLICSTAAENALSGVMTTAQMDEYRCACCKMPCANCESNLGLEDLQDGASLSSAIGTRMSEFTDPTKAATLFSSGSANAMSFSAEDVFGEMTKFMVATCLNQTSCAAPTVNTTTSGARSYVYSPTPTEPWKFAWDVLASNAGIPADIKDTINNDFTFTALPEEVCPYHQRYCIPFPGVAFAEGSLSQCIPKVDAGVTAVLGEAMSSALQGASEQALRLMDSSSGVFGEMMSTMDSFCVVLFFSFVIGLVFLVLLRFVVGVVVWASVFLVAAGFAFGGLMMYIRSFQCSGAGILETGFSTGVQVVTTVAVAAQDAVSGTTLSEAMTGNGQDYRGGQRYTRSLYQCQHWDKDSPHVISYNLTAYPELQQNYCRNPDGLAQTIWCYTTDKNKQWELCDPVGLALPECTKGYAVEDGTLRDVLKAFAYIIWAFGGIWIIAVCFLQKRIRLAVAVNKVAAQFVYNNPTILAVPVVQIAIGFAWLLIWIVCASFLLSQVPAAYTPTDSFATYMEAFGNDTTPGACTDKWPSGTVWKYEGDLSSANDTCSGVYGDTTGMEPKCWRCYPPRYAFDYKFAGAFFTLLWNNAFLVALGQLIVAGACAQWFFTSDERRGKENVIRQSLRIAFRYHLGTVAFGAFILALVQFIRYLCKYFEKQASAQKNRVMALVLRVLGCVIWIIEKCIKFLNKNAYIQVALMGTNFCTSAKNAFQLILRNMVRFGVVAILGTVIHFIGWTVITITTAVVGYFIFQAFHPDADPLLPMLTYIAAGYMVAHLFMSVFGLGVDTSLQCFIAAEEMGIAEEYVPDALKTLVDKNPGKKKWGLFSKKVAPA